MTCVAAVVFVFAHVGVLGGLPPDIHAAERYFPPNDQPTWARAEASQHPFDERGLEGVVNYAKAQNSSALLILYRGKIVAEHYWDVVASGAASRRYRSMRIRLAPDRRPTEDVASVQKSLVSTLVGIAVDKGLVSLDDSVSKHLGKGWSSASTRQESAIKVRHLLEMTSGLTANLRYSVDPGVRWRYNSTAYSKSLDVVAAASGLTPNEVTAKWLTNPLGMQDSAWRKRRTLPGAGNPYGFTTTARDVARFGLLIQSMGKWNDAQVVSSAFLKQALAPSQTMNPSYGLLWWLNGQRFSLGANGIQNRGPLCPTAPMDMTAALGALGRKCYVSRGTHLVVVRLGDAPSDQDFDKQFWQLLTAAMNASSNE